jgi:hypothetical protein
MSRHSRAENRAGAREAGTRRTAARAARMRQRIALAPTPEAAMNAAYDWVRSSAQRMCKGETRTGSRPDRPGAEKAMRKVTELLAEAAAAMDEGSYAA